MKSQIILLILLSTLLVLPVNSQPHSESIKWMDFEELDESLNKAPGKVVIYFYADWCVYCKKMEKNGFKDHEIIKSVNEEFYAVKMNVETTDSIVFDGQEFRNEQALSKRNGIHQLALLLTGYSNGAPPLPAILVLDNDFVIRKKSHEYLTSAKLKELLKI